ncbi:MAG: hypothetical protein FD126_574 [Elusimicrobia bacterium]|nr:MAG: hypothetical protein FD126_574 [Elusimicrobiota bacterium]
MGGVLSLFLIPVGGGIPAGVLLAQKLGLRWPVTAALYFVSDVLLAFAFEPVLLGLAAVGRRVPSFARLAAAFRESMDRTSAHYGKGAGPFALVMIAFGVDPMTGRGAAAAAGHGFVAGWAIAIAGDMMYFGVVMAATLKLSDVLGSPDRAVAAVLAAMFLLPMLARRFRAPPGAGVSAGAGEEDG